MNKLTRLWKSIPHAIIIGIATFFIAILIVLGSEMFLNRITSIILSFVFLIVIILIGIIFDVIGVAVAVADEAPLHAKAANKIDGALTGVVLVRNADRVASFTSDFVGDISGTVSGALGASIIFRLVALNPSYNIVILSTVMTGFVAALTVSGKALGKTIAINEADNIVFQVSRFLSLIEKKFGIKVVKNLSERKQRR